MCSDKPTDDGRIKSNYSCIPTDLSMFYKFRVHVRALLRVDVFKCGDELLADGKCLGERAWGASGKATQPGL